MENATRNMPFNSFKTTNGMCFKCGGSGHNFKQCPFKNVRLSFAFGVCYKCWAPVHDAKQQCFKQEHVKRTICSLYFNDVLRRKVESAFGITIPCQKPQAFSNFFCRNANFMYKVYVFLIT